MPTSRAARYAAPPAGCRAGCPPRAGWTRRRPRTSERSPLRDVATTGAHESIVAAVQAGDRGDCDARVFTLDEAIAPERVPALLPTLPMPCVDGLGPTDRFRLAVRPVDETWRLLFATASMGGMGSSGVQAAYGRLWAWRSTAGLSGAPAGASAQEVERHARQSTWFHSEADTDWFHNDIGSDHGMAALSPDRRRLAVLAATDTDWHSRRTSRFSLVNGVAAGSAAGAPWSRDGLAGAVSPAGARAACHDSATSSPLPCSTT
ncbi:DUF6183 family protein [Streptomyces sp. NPDC058442]|uniref:DUF6183 family protein n=1 Tax=Streptomyces sp. NPDC058442 TaxID=3346503 RepID=UPI00364723F1